MWIDHVWPVPDSLNKVSVDADTKPTGRIVASVN